MGTELNLALHHAVATIVGCATGGGVVGPTVGAIGNVGVGLEDPCEELGGVGEGNLLAHGGTSVGRGTSGLDLLNEVLVVAGSEHATLSTVEVNVVDKERHIPEGHCGGLSSCGTTSCYLSDVALGEGTERDVDTNVVVEKGNEGEGKTGVTAEPELEGYVKGCGGLRVDSQVGESGSVTNHDTVTLLLAGGHGEFVPDVEPLTVLLVNNGTTNVY